MMLQGAGGSINGLLRGCARPGKAGGGAFEFVADLITLKSLEMHSARFAPPYATTLPRNYFTFKKGELRRRGV